MIVYLRGQLSVARFLLVHSRTAGSRFAGSYLGKIALNRLDQRNFRRIVLLFIFLIGLTTLGKALEQLR
jgi:uncharacterized membrane protein YfcA